MGYANEEAEDDGGYPEAGDGEELGGDEAASTDEAHGVEAEADGEGVSVGANVAVVAGDFELGGEGEGYAEVVAEVEHGSEAVADVVAEDGGGEGQDGDEA